MLLQEVTKTLLNEAKKSVRLNFGMPTNSDTLILQESTALGWPLGRRWFIDTNEITSSISGEYYNFHLKNPETCLSHF